MYCIIALVDDRIAVRRKLAQSLYISEDWVMAYGSIPLEKRLKDKVNLLEKEKEQLIEESEKLSRTRKRTRMICLMFAFLCVVSSVVLACNLLK